MPIVAMGLANLERINRPHVQPADIERQRLPTVLFDSEHVPPLGTRPSLAGVT